MKFFQHIDLNGNELKGFSAEKLASAPSAYTGRIYFNTTSNTFYGYTGSVWVDLARLGLTPNSQSANYTLVLADGNNYVLHPASDANDRTFTIPANASVAYPVGTVITFVNMSTNALTIAITSDTMYLIGSGSTGSRALAQFGMATALKIDSTTWVINGTNLS